MRKIQKIKDTSCSCDDSCCDSEKALFQITKEPIVRVRHNPKRSESGNCSTGSCSSSSLGGQLNFVYVQPQFDLYYNKSLVDVNETSNCDCNENSENLTLNYYYKLQQKNNLSLNSLNSTVTNYTELKKYLIMPSFIEGNYSNFSNNIKDFLFEVRNYSVILKNTWRRMGLPDSILNYTIVSGYDKLNPISEPNGIACFPCNAPGCCGNSGTAGPCLFGCCMVVDIGCWVHDTLCANCEPRAFCGADCIKNTA